MRNPLEPLSLSNAECPTRRISWRPSIHPPFDVWAEADPDPLLAIEQNSLNQSGRQVPSIGGAPSLPQHRLALMERPSARVSGKVALLFGSQNGRTLTCPNCPMSKASKACS